MTRSRNGADLLHEYEGAEVLGHVIWVPVLHASGLPAHEVTLGISAEAVDSI